MVEDISDQARRPRRIAVLIVVVFVGAMLVAVTVSMTSRMSALTPSGLHVNGKATSVTLTTHGSVASAAVTRESGSTAGDDSASGAFDADRSDGGLSNLAPPVGEPASEIDLTPVREVAADASLSIDRLEVIQNGDLGLGLIDGLLTDPVTGEYIVFTVDPNAPGLSALGFEPSRYTERAIEGGHAFVRADDLYYEVIAETADAGTMVSLSVGSPDPLAERSEQMRDAAWSTVLPVLIGLGS